jgi:hypothetical protein
MFLMAGFDSAAPMGVVIICGALGYHVSWHPNFRKTVGVTWSDYIAANNGYVFGMAKYPTRAEWVRSVSEE